MRGACVFSTRNLSIYLSICDSLSVCLSDAPRWRGRDGAQKCPPARSRSPSRASLPSLRRPLCSCTAAAAAAERRRRTHQASSSQVPAAAPACLSRGARSGRSGLRRTARHVSRRFGTAAPTPTGAATSARCCASRIRRAALGSCRSTAARRTAALAASVLTLASATVTAPPPARHAPPRQVP